ATATDAAGNTTVSSTALNFVVDTVAPVVSISSVTVNSSLTFTASGTTDLPGAGQTITLVEGANDLGLFDWRVTTTTDANGNWSIAGVPLYFFHSPTVIAYDAAGNLGLSEYVYGHSSGSVFNVGGRQYVYATANNVVLNSGAQQNIYANGTASGT